MRRFSRILELRSVFGTGGGPDKTIFAGARLLDPSKYATIICYICDERDLNTTGRHRSPDGDVPYVQILERGALDWRIWPQLRRVVRDHDIQIVHAHDYKTDLLALMLARAEGVIPLSTAHGWSGHTWRERYVYYPLDRRLLARFPHVIAVSSDMRDALIRAGADGSRVTVILNGIDHVQFARVPELRSSARQTYAPDATGPLVGAIGRLEPEKNYFVLIRAFASVAKTISNAVLLIAGEGSLRPELETEIARLGLDNRCRLLGHIGEIKLFHHALDAFVQSSDNEGTPNAVLEAMALQTPVVATNVGGTSELARDRIEALLVPRRNERALADAIIDVLSDPQGSAERVAAARRRVEGELSFEHRMRRLEAVYDRLLGAAQNTASCVRF